MVTKSVAIRYINQEIDRKVRQFISIYAEDQAIDRLNTEDISGNYLSHIIECLKDYFNQNSDFLENMERLNQERNYLLTQADIFDDSIILQYLMNIAEADDHYQLLDAIMNQYFFDNNHPDLIRNILALELGLNLRSNEILSDDESDNLIDYIHSVIGHTNDIYSPIGIAHRLIYRINIATVAESTIEYHEFIERMMPSSQNNQTYPVVENNIIAEEEYDSSFVGITKGYNYHHK